MQLAPRENAIEIQRHDRISGEYRGQSGRWVFSWSTRTCNRSWLWRRRNSLVCRQSLFRVAWGPLVRTVFYSNDRGICSGLLCILITLPQGWETALIVGICIIPASRHLRVILEPRIFNNTVGVHPIIIIFAIFAGIERFGILGALLAVPVAGITQEIVIAYWKRYQAKNADQFPPEVPKAVQPELEAEKLTKTLSEN